MEDKNLQIKILKKMKEKGGRLPWALPTLEWFLKVNREKLIHNAHLLEKDKKIVRIGDEITGLFYELNSEGYRELDPFYRKAWRFFTNDFAKILSVIAIFLSIIATIISLVK